MDSYWLQKFWCHRPFKDNESAGHEHILKIWIIVWEDWCSCVRFGSCSGGRIIRVSGHNLDVVQEPKMRVTLSPPDALPPRRRRSIKKKKERHLSGGQDHIGPLKRWRRIVPEVNCPKGALCREKHVSFCECSQEWKLFCESVFEHFKQLICASKLPVVSFSTNRAARWTAPFSSCVRLLLWVQRPEEPELKFTSCWTASILTLAPWVTKLSATSPTPYSTSWTRTTRANRTTTNLAASSLSRWD